MDSGILLPILAFGLLQASYRAKEYFQHLGLVGDGGGRVPAAEGRSLGLGIFSPSTVAEKSDFFVGRDVLMTSRNWF